MLPSARDDGDAVGEGGMSARRRTVTLDDGVTYVVDYWPSHPGTHLDPPEGAEIAILDPDVSHMGEPEMEALASRLITIIEDSDYEGFFEEDEPEEETW